MLPHEHHGHEYTHDKRFQEFVGALQSGSAKNTLKQVRKVLKKGVSSQTDLLLFRIVEAMALQQLSENAQAEKCLIEISDELVKLPEFNGHIITAFLYTVKLQGLSQLSMSTLEKLYKKHPKNEELAENLFAECIATNNFFRLNLLAKELEGKTKQEVYTLSSMYSLYMFAKHSDPSNPSTKGYIKLANMELLKYLGTHKIKAEELPANIYEIYRKIMIASDMHEELLKSLKEQKTLTEEKKNEYICMELKTLKQYPELINQLLKLTLDNIKKGKDAKFAYETYQRMLMLLIVYCFSTIKEPSEILKVNVKAMYETRDKLACEDIFILDTMDPLNTLKKVFEIFISMATKGKDPGVSLNEVRGANLLILLGLHKFMLFSLKNGLVENCKEISETILNVMQNYIKNFSTTVSVYSEIVPYCTSIETKQREELIQTAKEAKEMHKEDYTKYLISTILYYKLKVSLISPPEPIVLLDEVMQLYNEAITKLNKKLEKGERHPADDLILIADYILQILDIKKEGAISPLTVIRILLLNQGLKSSTANFDIRVQLLKVLMNHNLNYMTREVYDGLKIKAVLTETLAYIYEKYLIEFVQIDKLNKVSKKFYKFVARNTKGTESTKTKAIREGNFVQAEEFYEYERHQTNSHHRIVLSTVITLFEYLQNIQTKGINLFAEVGSKINEQIQLLKTPEKLIKSADVHTLQEKIKHIPLLSQYSADIKNTFDISIDKPWEDLILDPILLPYIAIGKTNYKQGIINLFGVLELPELNLLLHSLCMLLVSVTNNPSVAMNLKDFDSDSVNFKVAVKSVENSKVFSEYSMELNDLVHIFEFNGLMLNSISVMKDISSSKDQTEIVKRVEELTKLLDSTKERMSTIVKTIRSLIEKTEEGLLHPLMPKNVMRRFIMLLTYFGISSNLLFPLIKSAFPTYLNKKKDETGKMVKKLVVDLKKEITNTFNDTLNISQKFKVNEEVKHINDFPSEFSKVTMIGELINSQNAKEVLKSIKEEVNNGISRLEVIFRPMVKALIAIDI